MYVQIGCLLDSWTFATALQIINNIIIWRGWMPKQRITKEMIVDAAFAIARSDGMERVMVQTIANRIGCSVQ